MSPRPFRNFKTTIVVIISVIISIFAGTLIFGIFTVQQLNRNLALQLDTRTVIIGLKDNLTLLLNAETGGRGFTITGDTIYLEPFYQAKKDYQANLSFLANLLKEDSADIASFDSLSFYSREKIEFLNMAMNLKKSGNDDTIKVLAKGGNGKFLMDKVRFFNSQLQDSENKLFSTRKIETDKSIATTKFIFTLSGILAVLIILFFASWVINELNRRLKHEQALKEYAKNLQQKNKEIEQFAFIASHDLQQPLRTITNFAGLLEERVAETGDKESAQFSGFITKGAMRMADLIKDLLEYSRTGRDLQKTSIDCNRMIKEVIEELHASIDESKATITISQLPTVQGYESLRSVFRNLLTNAIKYSIKGKPPEITVSATENQREYLFHIKDNGIGIEPKYKERIFDIFQRLHSREEYPGTGIGLSICKKVIEMHGGLISVDSTPGDGSCFNFTIIKTS
ncbi:MAG: ATP-binding protein [Chitinophagaceae bacterium]